MRLTSLKIDGFRNWQKTVIAFDPDKPLTVFIGPNGHGKTNFLEAIYLLALSKSFRARENDELIGFDADFCRIEGDLDTGSDSQKLEFILTRSPAKKTLKKSGVIQKAADFIGQLRVVFFSPDDMNMIHQSPALRRRYLDVLISQVDRGYLGHLLSYQDALRQRNALLKRVANKQASADELVFWNTKLALSGLPIQQKRRQVVADLTPVAQGIYKAISGRDDLLTLHYDFAPDTHALADYEAALVVGLEADLWRGSTQLGPHRDDMALLLNDKPMASFGSRGEWRSAILALKMAEMEWIKIQTGDYPILLLDDVFSELDSGRQQYLIEALNKTQTFLTTAYESVLSLLNTAHGTFRVEAGALKKA